MGVDFWLAVYFITGTLVVLTLGQSVVKEFMASAQGHGLADGYPSASRNVIVLIVLLFVFVFWPVPAALWVRAALVKPRKGKR